MISLLHVTEDHSPANTGITSAVDGLMRQVQPALQQSLLTTGSETIPLPRDVPATLLPLSGIQRVWRAAPRASQELIHTVRRADVIHLHGIWMWPQWAAARAARESGKPFLLSSHGMLEPWIWQRQPWPHQLKKKLYWQLLAYPALRYASLVHAIHPREASNLKTYFPNRPVEVIPLSIDLDSVDRILLETLLAETRDPYVLFLGRIHPVKGIDLLIQAFARLDAPRLRLKIAGPIQPRESEYAARLRQLVASAGVEDRVEFLGAVQGAHKWALLRSAWVFCLPSHSEVISMVNLEAAACSTPVITTTATGISNAWSENGGMLVDNDVTALASALEQAYHWSVLERRERGQRLRGLIETTYSWNATAARWLNLYQRLVQKI